jgi:hypothetical protein
MRREKHRAPNYRPHERDDGVLRECRNCDHGALVPTGALSNSRRCRRHHERVSDSYVCDDHKPKRLRQNDWKARLRRTFDWIFGRRRFRPQENTATENHPASGNTEGKCRQGPASGFAKFPPWPSCGPERDESAQNAAAAGIATDGAGGQAV